MPKPTRPPAPKTPAFIAPTPPKEPALPVQAPVEASPPSVDVAAVQHAERAACASFIEHMDIGSESIRNAIAKALRERK